MKNVIFVAPFPAETTRRFIRAVRSLGGVRLLGVAHTLPDGPDAGLFDDAARVENPLDVGELAGAIERLCARHGAPYRILGILENLQVELAKLREHFGVEGTDVRTAELFRDKARMKDALREAGLPCARHRLVREWKDASDFVDEVGFPIVLKPPAGMACKATWRINDVDQLKGALSALRPSSENPTLAEEFLRGREYSFETITVGGEVQLASSTEYHPTPLEVVENPWIQWAVIAPRVPDPKDADAEALCRAAVKTLGLKSGMTHMEWFRRADGSLAVGEIAARPPGANIVRLHGLVYETSFYRAWARAVVDDAFDGPWERRHAAGCAFLRGIGRGRVMSVTGVQKTHEALGELIVEASLPKLGAPRSESYEGDGYALVRHSDTEVVKDAVRRVIDTVRVHYA